MHAVAAMSRAADQELLAQRGEFGAGHDDLPDSSRDVGEKPFGRRVCEQAAVGKQRNTCCDGFNVRNDVRGKNYDALAGKLREQVAKAYAFFRIETRSRL